ncbi:MAG TPA: hypothetical protein VNW47_16025 [Terriglobales bacterium]|jgi:hypothetical protein|nr:hypothetical protein [Terriglobales bacterium]
MKCHPVLQRSPLLSLASFFLVAVSIFGLTPNVAAQSGAWLTHSHDEQHTGVSSVASQALTTIHWHVPADLAPPNGEILIHYGSPLVTAANTVIVPVKTTTGFRVEAHNGVTGKKMWTQATKYQVPSASFVPAIGPTLSNNQLLVPDYAGRVIVRQTPDQTRGTVTRLVFYGKKNYNQNPTVYQQNVQINTPLSTDAAGNVYFGFLVLGPTPINLQSGLARVTPNGTGIWVSAASISADAGVTGVAMSCAPALSNDGNTVYIATTNANAGYGYLVALNSTTLTATNRVRMKDPSSGQDALIYDASSATPTVGPDGDVYFGVLENPFPSHNDRGWLLHFSSDLSQKKTPGSFGWDDTASIVPASMVPSYHGTSTYLVMTKYNNYAGAGGDGHNRLAILDPNATQNDPILTSVLVMKSVLTVLGVTPDPQFPQDPGAVREWCINTAAIDPATKSVIANSEDGKVYRWDLTTNTLTESVQLTTGIGEAYTPTVIGPDGTVYAINGAIVDAIGK